MNILIDDGVTLPIPSLYPQNCYKAWTLMQNIPFGENICRFFPSTTAQVEFPPSHDICEYLCLIICDFNEITRTGNKLKYVLENIIWIIRMWRFLPHTHVFYVLPIFFLSRVASGLQDITMDSIQDLEPIAATRSYHDPPLVQFARCASKLCWKEYPS